MIFDPENIERELERIQRENSPTEARTAILNLVVFSRQEAAARTEEALGHVVGRRAARVMHVVQKDQGESEVSLSARCYLDRERKSVCVQEILIDSGRDGVGAAPGTWTPLLIRDLPVYALWFDTISDKRELLEDVQEQCDTLIVDSEQSVAFGESAHSVVTGILGELGSQGVVVSDFAWQRLQPLRRVTARYFDPPRNRGRLEQIRGLRVSDTSPMFAGLYVAWLAGRLNWYVEGDRVADHSGREISVEIDQGSRNTGRSLAAQAQNVTVTVDFSDGASLQLSGRPEGTLRMEKPDGGEEVDSFTIPSDGEIVLAEIDAVRSENLYTEALRVLGRAPWAP